MKVLAIDPGIAGAFVLTDGKTFKHWAMPIRVEGKDKHIDFDGVYSILKPIGQVQVFLERAVPMAQGAKSAFNYGRGFEVLTIALKLLKMPMTLVEPGKWSKEMHDGISSDLKPKVKSRIAVERLLPHMVASIPKNTKGMMLDGPIDALLIATYGLRKLGRIEKPLSVSVSEEMPDFY